MQNGSESTPTKSTSGFCRAASTTNDPLPHPRSRRTSEKRARPLSMAEFVYQFYKARKAHGDKVILDDVTVGVYPGAKIGVVGPNGAGKSTLLKVMASPRPAEIRAMNSASS